jgi:D-3-phosphoglycerate dehydrogenase
MAKLAQGIRMQVQAFDPFVCDAVFKDLGVSQTNSLDELLATCDAVSLHCPLVPATRHILNAERLAMMQSGSFVVNAARGGVVDEAALIAALQSGHIAGAALDSFETEPLPKDDPLLKAPNLILTPHIGGSTEQALLKVGCAAAEAILETLSGGALDGSRIVNSKALEAT